MKRIVVLIVVLLVLVVAGVMYFRWTRPAPAGTDLVPETTLMFLDVPDFPKARTAFQGTPAYALWQEPEVQRALQPLVASLGEALGQRLVIKRDEKGATPILDAIEGEAFLALTHVSVMPVLQPGLVLGADVKRRRLEVGMGLNQLKSRLQAQNPHAQFHRRRYDGVDYDVWEIRPHYPVCHTFLHSLLVVTLGEDNMREVIGRFTHQSKSTVLPLSASARYREVVRRMPPGHEFLAYLNIEQMVGMLGPLAMMMPQSGGMLDRLTRIRASGSGFKFSDGIIHDVRYVAYNGTNQTPPAAVARRTIAFTTPQTAIYWAQTTDVPGLYRSVTDSLALSGKPALANSAARFDRQIRSFRNHLLGALGPETALIGTWRPAMKFPDLALVAEIRDPERTKPEVDQALQALKDATAGNDDQAPWDVTEYQGHTLHTIRFGSGRLAPTYAMTEGFLVVALTPDYARQLLDQDAAAGRSPSREFLTRHTLEANPAYAKVTARLPANGSAYAYCDLRAIFEPWYGLAQNSEDALPLSEKPARLPRAETIAKHLSPFASATVADAAGVTTTAFSPVSSPGVFLGAVMGGALTAYALLPQMPGSPIPGLPKKLSDTGAPSPSPGNQTAASRTPASP